MAYATENELLLIEVVKNITRENNIRVVFKSSDSISVVINIYLENEKSIFFLKKLTDRLVSIISGAYKITYITYHYKNKILYSYTNTYGDKEEGFGL